MDDDIQTVLIHYLIRQDYPVYVKERLAINKGTEMDLDFLDFLEKLWSEKQFEKVQRHIEIKYKGDKKEFLKQVEQQHKNSMYIEALIMAVESNNEEKAKQIEDEITQFNYKTHLIEGKSSTLEEFLKSDQYAQLTQLINHARSFA